MSINDKFKLSYSEQFLIDGIEEQDINLDLDDAVVVGGSLTGQVTDNDGFPVEDVTVKIFDAAGKPFRHTLTDSNGNYSFDNLPQGNYTVTAAKKKYILSVGNNIVLGNNELKILDLKILEDTTKDLTAIAGVVFDNNSKNVISDAFVVVQDSEGVTVATTVTAADGEYVFYDLPANEYKVFATKDGYIPNSAVEVSTRENALVNAFIKLSNDPKTNSGTISGIVKNNNNIVPNCFVGLYDIISNEGIDVERLVSVTKTNSNGAYMFGKVGSGNYKVKAKLNGRNI